MTSPATSSEYVIGIDHRGIRAEVRPERPSPRPAPGRATARSALVRTASARRGPGLPRLIWNLPESSRVQGVSGFRHARRRHSRQRSRQVKAAGPQGADSATLVAPPCATRRSSTVREYGRSSRAARPRRAGARASASTPARGGRACRSARFIFPTEYSIRIDELARALEERGLSRCSSTEHTHIPVSRRTAVAGRRTSPEGVRAHPGSVRRARRGRGRDDRGCRLGTGICLVIQHDPIVTAKEVATLDLLSNGRFLFGVGAGWNAEEMEHHGTAFPTRFRVMRERVLAMKEIWTKDEAEFHGEFVRLRPIWSYPEAGPEAASAGPPGRRGVAHAPARGRVLRRLVPARARRGRHHPRPAC